MVAASISGAPSRVLPRLRSTGVTIVRARRFSHSSKDRLTEHDAARFTGESLFDGIGRAVCQARCLPRKELYESWEMARRVRRLCRGGRVVDLGGGHGLLAHILLLLDNSSEQAVVIDHVHPPCSGRLHQAITAPWPRLVGRVSFETGSIEHARLYREDLVVSSHACGGLTDVVLERAAAVRARVAVLPCCHDLRSNDGGALAGWMDPTLAIDAMRAVRLQQQGYQVWTQTIPDAITPKNRLLIGIPRT
jgi:hypothetical protein